MHNSYFAQLLKKRGYDPAVYFQGSVQLDGGLVSVTNKIMNALTETKDAKETKQNKTKETWCSTLLPVLSSGLTIGLVRVGNVNDSPYLGSDDQGVKAVAARLASNLLTACLSRGVNVVVPTSSGLYQNAEFLDTGWIGKKSWEKVLEKESLKMWNNIIDHSTFTKSLSTKK